jgi:chromosome segregation ATPase
VTIEELTKAVGDLTRRLNIAETKLSQHAGQFEFITGQLRDVQLYMHARFDDLEKRLDKMDGRFDKMDGRLDRMDGRLDKMDGRLDKMDGRLGRVETEIRNLNDKMDALPRVIAEMIATR